MSEAKKRFYKLMVALGKITAAEYEEKTNEPYNE